MDQKPNIAIYLQHYLAPSMTFIYRQLRGIETDFYPVVFCSDQKENLDKFPFNNIYHRQRNFIHFKKSKYYQKIYGSQTLLNTDPKLSLTQKKYFSNLIDKKKIKLIHAHFGPSGVEILPLAQQKKIPLVVTFHGYDASILFTMEQYTRNIKKVFESAKIIAVSDMMKDELIQHGANENEISVIRCGISTEEFSVPDRIPLFQKKNTNELISLLQISSFVEKKGHEYTVRAFKDFLQFYPNSKLTLAGDGYLKTRIQKLCDELGISERVLFPGNIDYRNVPELMRSADIFLHHSVTSAAGDKEGIPTVLMEAMASGLPVISTYHSGIPELIDDNINGLLVNERDLEGYTQKLIRMLDDKGELGKQARDKIETKFNLKKQNELLMKFYRKNINRSYDFNDY